MCKNKGLFWKGLISIVHLLFLFMVSRYSLFVSNADGSNFTNMDVRFTLETGGVYTLFISGDEQDVSFCFMIPC